MSDGGTQALSIPFDGQPYGLWRDRFCDELLDAEAPGKPVPVFGTADLIFAAGAITLDMQVGGPGLALARTPTRIAHDERPYTLGITYVLHGMTRLTCNREEIVLRPGDVSVLSSRDHFTKELGRGYREHFVYLPEPVAAGLFGRSLPELRRHLAPIGGLGPLLADALSSLARRRHALRGPDWPPLLAAVCHLVEATFGAADADTPERVRPAARLLQRDRVLRYIDEHLGEPNLSPSGIAAALGLSIRYLHLLFQDAAQSVGETILARRLDRCRERLADPAFRHLHISEVAFAAGFNDTAHFSRAFKARFGLRPKDVREA